MEPKEANISSDDEPFQRPKVQAEDESTGPEQKVEKIILEQQQQRLQRSNRSILSQDIEMKLEQVLEDIKQDEGNNFQSIISLRMKELAYSKILVLTYQKSYFRLVQAHFHIGKQYLKFKCYEQAFNHIQTAIQKNAKASQNSVNKLFHSYLLTYLGESLYHLEKLEEALKQLNRALNIQRECQEKDKKNINNIETLKYLALTKAELRLEDATEEMQIASEKAKEICGEKDKTYALMLFQQGNLEVRNQEKQKAILFYERSIQVLKMSNQENFQEDLIKIYQQLANIYEATNPQQFISTLKLKYQVFEDNYGNSDKRSIKEQRNLVTALLKHKKIDQSLEQCQDILEKQKKVYGQNSLEVGKQHRTIANILIAKHDYKGADNNFKKALKIFHDLGDQRLARQVKMKMASLQQRQ